MVLSPGAGRAGAVGVACFLCRRLALPLVFFPAPIPPPPFPAGRGRSKVYFAGGFAPGTPALDRSRHLQLLLCGHPAQGSQWFAVTPTETFFFRQCRQPRRGGTGGEELRRLRWSSPPGRVEQVPPPAQPWGCKGRSPLHKKTKNLPLPRRGRGVGGWGKEIKLKAGAAGDKAGKPPLGHHSGRGSQCRAGASPPLQAPQRQG